MQGATMTTTTTVRSYTGLRGLGRRSATGGGRRYLLGSFSAVEFLLSTTSATTLLYRAHQNAKDNHDQKWQAAPAGTGSCEVGPACGPNGENRYTSKIYHYFKASDVSNDPPDTENLRSVWRHESLDLDGIQTVKELAHFVAPGICGHRHFPDQAPKTSGPCGKNLDKWAPREKTIFAFDHWMGSHKRLVMAQEDPHDLMRTLPDDDSTRVLAVTSPFVHSVSCEAYDADRIGTSPKCAQIHEALVAKGRQATANDFQQMRAECVAEQVDETEWMLKKGGKKQQSKKCIYRESHYTYWARDNGKDEISVSLRNTRGGNEFNSRYVVDRPLLNVLAHLPGSHYCVGPHDRLSKDHRRGSYADTRSCACRGYANGGVVESGGRVMRSWDERWREMSETERDHWLMLQSFKDMGVNWWGEDETVRYRDLDPCGSGATRRPSTTTSGRSSTTTHASGSPGKKKNRHQEQLQPWQNVTTNSCGEQVDGDDRKVGSSACCHCSSFLSAGTSTTGGGETSRSSCACGEESTTAASGVAPPKNSSGRDDDDVITANNDDAEDNHNDNSIAFPDEVVGEQFFRLAGKRERGDWVKSIFEYFGPLVEKIAQLDHGGDLSKTAFYGNSEGGAIMFEVPLYLMHKKILEELKKHATGTSSSETNGGKQVGIIRTAQELAAKVLTTKELRRPFCVAGVYGPNIVARPQILQGRYNWKRLTDIAAICHDLTKWSISVAMLDTTQHVGFYDARFHPHVVLHQLRRIAAAGFQHVESWEVPMDHSGFLMWALPPHERHRTQKVDGADHCKYHERLASKDPTRATATNGAFYPYASKAERQEADATTKQLSNLFQAEVENGICLKPASNSWWLADHPFSGYDPEKLGMAEGVQARALYGGAFGVPASPSSDLNNWAKFFTPLVQLAFLSTPAPIKEVGRKKGRESARDGGAAPPAGVVTRHVQRDFNAFRKCIYVGSLGMKKEAAMRQIDLVGEEFEFSKWKQEFGKDKPDPFAGGDGDSYYQQGHEEEEDDGGGFLQKLQLHVLGGAAADKNENQISVGNGNEETRRLFGDDKFCQFAEPDGDWLPLHV